MQRTFDDLGTPLSRGHVLRRRPRDHGGIAAALRHHRGRRGQGPRRRVPRHVPDPREPGHAPSRRRSPCSPASPRRWSCPRPRIEPVLAGVRRVQRGHGDRRAQRALRPRRSSHAARRASGWAPLTQPVGRHVRARPAPRARRGAQLQAVARSRAASGSRTTVPPPRARRRARHRRPAALAARARRCATACSGSTTCSRSPRISGHPQAAKLRLTDRPAPRPGRVPLPRSRRPSPLRRQGQRTCASAVRSYFSSDDRRKIGQLLRETQQIDHIVCTGPLDAAVLEVAPHPRAPAALQPARQAVAQVRLREAHAQRAASPASSVVRVPRADGACYLGPLPSAAAAQRVVEAIETAMPLAALHARAPGAADAAGAVRARAARRRRRARARARSPTPTTRAIVERTCVRGITTEPDAAARAAAASR